MDIAKWDAGTWIAAVAALIALVAAWASWRQAAAAKDQVAIMQQQLKNEQQQLQNDETDRHRAAGPKFEFDTASVIENPDTGQPVAKITVKQEGGPEHSEVTVTVRRTGDIHGLIGNDGRGIVDSIIWKDNAPGAKNVLKVSLERDDPVDVALEFRSVEPGNDRPWTFTETTSARKRMRMGSLDVASPKRA